MIEGFWMVQFHSSLGLMGAGVVILQRGNIYGGDTAFSYLGTYESDNRGRISARIRIERHLEAGAIEMDNVMGAIGDYDLVLTGDAQPQQFRMDGHVAENRDLEMWVELKRKCDIL